MTIQPKKKILKKGRPSAANPTPAHPVAIVGVGASAGGLRALTGLLKALPTRTGLAFVLIQHLDPQHPSSLTQLLAKNTSMPVLEVADGIAALADHVYVIPPNKSMSVRDGKLRLTPRAGAPNPHHPIDEFYSALAREQKGAAMGVILSGSGTDGTLGLKEIKAEGGVTFAQEPKTAEWPGMPISAIAAGAVDYVLPPARIAAELTRIARHPYIVETHEAPEGDELERIYRALRAATGVDFHWYKQHTVRRRVARRMAQRKIDSLAKYAQLLKQNRAEAEAAAEDIFIHVTGFFRDPECFEALRKQVLPKLRAHRAPDDPVRIWVPGCSTGEEVYTIAMLLIEDLSAHSSRLRIQMFGTDISERAIDFARAGVYSEAALHGVSPVRLKRFFSKADHGYQIHKAVRDLCVFARHDLASDPPFSRLDLISARNVLIYMGPALQKRVLGTFHYALKPGGALMLGKSEAITTHANLFGAEDHTHKIFARKTIAQQPSPFDWFCGKQREQRLGQSRQLLTTAPVDFQKEAERVLLSRYVPPALVVDSDLRVVHFQGDTSPYLALATGPPTFHLFKIVRPEFVVEIRNAISRAKRHAAASSTALIDYDYKGHSGAARIDVSPLRSALDRKKNYLLVFCETSRVAEPPAGARRSGHKDQAVGRLERELSSAKESMRSLIADYEASQEEMKAAHEEILSSNEELQSTNEELETAKEELQSSNEELITLNEELRHRNLDLSTLTNDLNNLLVGVQIPVLVLDGSLQIRRFTPVAGKLLNLIDSDVGRPFTDIASTFIMPDWNKWVAEVIDDAHPIEREVKDRKGFWYLLRLRPYRTSDNGVDGVIVVLLNIDLIKRPLLEEAQESRDYASAMLESSGQAIVAVGADHRIQLVNRVAETMFGYSREQMVSQPFTLLVPETAQKAAAQIVEKVFAASSRKSSEGLSIEARRHDGSVFPVEVAFNTVERGERLLVVAFFTDVTERTRLEKQSEAYRREIGALGSQLLITQEEERRRISRELHDGLCQQLASVAMDVEGMAAAGQTPAVTRARLKSLQARIIDTSEQARNIAYQLHPSAVDDLGLAVALKALCADFSAAQEIPLRFTAGQLPAIPLNIASGLYRIAQESLQNITKHAKAKHAIVDLTARNHAIRLTINDDGSGFDPIAVTGRGGFGMASMAERAKIMGGRLSVRSKPSRGATIVVEVPLPADK